MDIDTSTIRRLRDGLLAQAAGGSEPPAGSELPESYQAAVHERFAPFAETMFLMMQVDGHTAHTELDTIRGAMRLLTDGALGNEALDAIIESSSRAVEVQGVEGRLQSVGARLASDRVDRETAFSLAAAVALADNKVERAELSLMESIAEWYGISNKRCREILSVL